MRLPQSSLEPLVLSAKIERWLLHTPFRITGKTWDYVEVLVVTLEQSGYLGRGEAAGVYYKMDVPERMLTQVESVRPMIEAGVDRNSLPTLLPPGGARNALDCALWDLEAKLTGRSVWQLAGLSAPRPLMTTFTCGADEPAQMAAAAKTYRSARALKLKLTGEPLDAERVRAVRSARADVWLGVDANQGFTRGSLERLMPVLTEQRVSLIEQPFPMDQDVWLDGYQSPIPIAADESAQTVDDLEKLTSRFSAVNIKLDKCGGLTAALKMARAASVLGLDVMIGNMLGTSLAMAPAFLVGQLCRLVDLDGPVVLKEDRAIGVDYSDGHIMCTERLWGA